MIGGFALIAYPADYGNSGVMTFMVNHAGTVYIASAGGGVYPVNQEFIPFSIFSPFGFDGRFVYGRFAVNF